MGERTCLGCEETKPLIAFGAARGKPRAHCKACVNVKRRERYIRLGGIESVRKYNLARYGLTPEDFARMLEAQGGLCAICGNPQSARNMSLCVDHNHSTGVVRQLLCSPCNFVVGFLEKNPVDPHLFVAYLDRHNGGATLDA